MSEQTNVLLGGGQAPFSQEAEEAVLGAVLVDPNALLGIASFLRPEDFYFLRHAHIWQALLQLNARNDHIDLVTLGNELQAMGRLEEIGGQGHLMQLAFNVPTSMHAEVYGRIVERAAVRRRLLLAADEIRKLAMDEQLAIETVTAEAEAKLFSVTDMQTRREITPMYEAISAYYDRVEQLLSGQQESLGLPTGFRELDKLLGGLQRSDLLIFAGRPGMGKTSWMLSLALNAARAGGRILIFTMEMGVEQITQRFLSMETGINMQKLRLGQLEPHEYSRFMEAMGRLSNLQIFIDDTPALNPIQMRTKTRRVAHEFGLDLVVVDYLQLMNGGKSYEANRVQEISYISRALKELARELNVPLLSAAQLSRAVEQRHDKRPVLSDLRESGCIAGDERVYLPETGEYVPIRDLAGKSGFTVLTLNTETWKMESGIVSRAFSTGIAPVYKMTTQLGRTIRATANHKFLTIDGWKRLDELSTVDHVALPRFLPSPSEQTMSDAELALLGHLIGDGCTLPTHAIQYTTRELDLAETVVALANEIFGDQVVPRIHDEKGRGWYQVFIPPSFHLTHKTYNPVAKWLRELGVFGLRSYEKRVPEKVFQQPAEAIALFLRHFWATDGCVRMRYGKRPYPAIYYATSSLELAQHVQTLLLRITINARLKPVPQGQKGRTQYHVIVSGQEDTKRFIATIGSVGVYKQQSLLEIENCFANLEVNPNRDIIPRGLWRKYAVPAMEVGQISTRQMYRGLETAYAGTALYKQNISRGRAARLANVLQSPEIGALSSSDVYWDGIKSIEPDGIEEVYDLTVPGNHDFVAGNIIVSNSIEQDSDVVMFLYRDVVYNEATEFPNQANVIVAKHRNGPTGQIDLYFEKSVTRFVDADSRTIDLREL